MSSQPFSDSLDDLIQQAIEHGVESIRDGGPLVPFVMFDGVDGERQLHRHFCPTPDGQGIDLDASVHAARTFGGSLAGKAFRAAVVIDGRAIDPDDNTKRDCLLTFAFEDGEQHQAIVGQIYFPAKGLRKFSEVCTRRKRSLTRRGRRSFFLRLFRRALCARPWSGLLGPRDRALDRVLPRPVDLEAFRPVLTRFLRHSRLQFSKALR